MFARHPVCPSPLELTPFAFRLDSGLAGESATLKQLGTHRLDRGTGALECPTSTRPGQAQAHGPPLRPNNPLRPTLRRSKPGGVRAVPTCGHLPPLPRLPPPRPGPIPLPFRSSTAAAIFSWRALRAPSLPLRPSPTPISPPSTPLPSPNGPSSTRDSKLMCARRRPRPQARPAPRGSSALPPATQDTSPSRSPPRSESVRESR